ncbi:carbohydrate-binding protein [Fibrobacter sp. UWEL]|uniref:carbohydrate-binding protein n=1 Tax=Fibrobacter sp. UWEL TaxID=1896209 RepID=UPI00091C31D9|nr:carbohydrate-binding protein [Fibrobacter sp. UWEL]SHL40991.1 Por secretion system C-terminal sorting domain-containing protein [Fibrobacter sp. UWEL]
MTISKAKKLVMKAMCGFGVLALPAFAYNPISTYHYLADPGAAADDEYFYVITDSDDPAVANASGYDIKALYGFRSKDMQNWTDFGIIYDARKVDGIGDIWASGIAVNPNDHRLYIVFPDGGGGGIGLIGADSIGGVWSNPVSGGKKLINNWGGGIADCDGIGWCFDPAIFFDDDGQGYFTFGGGSSDSRPAADNNNNIFNIYKLNKDMKGFDVSSKTALKIGGPKAMEASYIHKYKGNYYLSYSTADLRIAYGMSDNPMGPYTYKGIFMGNPNIGGQNINANNNNHHGIAEFKGHWYVAYHDRRIANGYDGLEKIPAEDGAANPTPAYHRSVSVDEFTYAADGSMNSLTFTKEGPKQIDNFDPYDWYPALTSSKQKGIRSRTNWTPGKIGEHLLLPLSTKESWIRVSGVDFGTAATGFTVEAASTASDDKIEIHTGTPTGTLAGTCTLKNTGSKATFAATSCDVDGLKGIVDYLFLVFKGSKDSTMAIKGWGFEGSGTTPPTPQSPFGGKAWAIPGTIQMEDFDVPGTGRGDDYASYNESDEANHACDTEGAATCNNYREGTGVDIYKKGDKLVVGYITEGEWLEYTVNVAETGTYTMYAAVASDGGSSFKLSIDGKDITEDIAVPAAKKAEGEEQNFDDYSKVTANVNLTKGEHVLRFTATADWFDIDYINFASGENAPDPNPLGKDAIGSQKLNLQVSGKNVFKVFDLRGQQLGYVDIFGKNVSKALNAAGFSKGVYMLKQVGGSQKMMVNTAK